MSNDDNIFDNGNLDSQDYELRKIYRDMASTDHTEQPKTTFQPKTSSKSAFTPIKSRSEPENPSSLASSESTFGSTSKSAFYKRQSSFGTSGSRGGLKKDQLTAQIKNFLGPDDPVVANKSATMVAETGEGQPEQQQLQGRKLPKSPEDERDRISRTSTPDNAGQLSPKNRSRSRNSNPSPLRVTSKPPTGESSSLPRPVERNGRSPPDPAWRKRPGSASRIPTPSGVNQSISGHTTNNGAGVTSNSNPNPTLIRRNSVGASVGSTKIPTPIKRPASLTVDDARNRASPKKDENIPNGRHPKDEPDSKLEFVNDFGKATDHDDRLAPGSRGQYEEDEVTTSLSSGANDHRRPSVVRRHSLDNRSGVAIMPTIPATPKTPKTPKTPLEVSTHQCEKERTLRRSLASPNFHQHKFEYESDQGQGHRVPFDVPGTREASVPFQPTVAPSSTNFSPGTPEISGSRYIPTETYKDFLEKRKFRSKHSDLLTEAYEIIGKYFPEKRMFAQSFYSSPTERSLGSGIKSQSGPILNPNFGSFNAHFMFPGNGFRHTQMQPGNFGGIQPVSRAAYMMQPVLYLGPRSALPSRPLLRHHLGHSFGYQ